MYTLGPLRKFFLAVIKTIISWTRFSVTVPARLLNAILIGLLSFLAWNLLYASTPNPGHAWSEVGDGMWAATGTTALRTFTFPDVNADVLTDYDIVQGDLLVGTAASTTARLPKDTNATRYLSNKGASNQPLWSTITLSDGVNGILSSSNGGTGNASTSFTGMTAARTYTLPDANSTILTSNAAVTLTQGGTGAALTASNGGIVYSNASTLAILGGTATAGQILRSGASSAPSWSTATYPATAGTNGYALISDGTNIVSGTTTDNVFFTTPGLHAANLTAVTAIPTNSTYFQYLGVAPKNYASCNILQNVTTAAATITWAEVGIFRGTPVINGAPSLTRLGSTSVSASYNTTGRKNTSVTATIKRGDNIWVAFGSQATTPFQVRGMLADDLQSGVFATTSGQLSGLAVPVTPTLGGTAAVPSWVMVKCQ